MLHRAHLPREKLLSVDITSQEQFDNFGIGLLSYLELLILFIYMISISLPSPVSDLDFQDS
jgi:hypothetical protein